MQKLGTEAADYFSNVNHWCRINKRLVSREIQATLHLQLPPPTSAVPEPTLRASLAGCQQGWSLFHKCASSTWSGHCSETSAKEMWAAEGGNFKNKMITLMPSCLTLQWRNNPERNVHHGSKQKPAHRNIPGGVMSLYFLQLNDTEPCPPWAVADSNSSNKREHKKKKKKNHWSWNAFEDQTGIGLSETGRRLITTKTDLSLSWSMAKC